SHNPSLESSQKAVRMLNAALTGPYPPGDTKNPPLDFKLDVEESEPGPDEMGTIRQYLEAESPPPVPSNYPIVVDWFGGRATCGPQLGGVTRILENLQKERDESFAGKLKSSWKFW
ncbi:hypothetical protein CPB85DRAFT_1225656, partial [Mucidula mucida]